MFRLFFLALLFSPLALAEEPVRFVVLKPTASLHISQGDPGRQFYPSRGSAESSEKAGILHAMRLVERQGDWVRVESIPNDVLNTQCQGSLWSLDSMRLRFWVKSSDLGVATTKPVTLKYPDGTSVALAQGLGATPKGSKFVVTLGVMQLQVALPKDALGEEFEAPTMFEDPETKDIVLVGGPVPDLIFDGANRIRTSSAASLIKSAHTKVRKGKEWLVTIRDSCGELVVRAKKAALSKARDEGGIIGGMLPAGGSSVRAAAPVYWASGERAGEIVDEPLLVSSPLHRQKERWCTDYDLVSDRDSNGPPPHDQTLSVCFDEKDITIGQ